MKNTLFTLIICTIFLTSSTFAQNQEQTYDSLLNELFPEDGPGGTALVVKNGQTVYLKAFGKANLELDIDMKPGNIFRIGSITKQFTACAILKLIEEGKLSLDDEITKFIEDYPTHGHKITIEHLLTHTSGIKSYTSLEKWDKEVRKKDFTPEEMINYFKDEPMDFAPGEKFLYNNSGYFILGYIIEKVSGKTYAAYIDETFFQPLGMKNSFYGNTTQIIKNRASGYQQGDGDYQNADFVSMTQPYSAGSLLSTVEDLSLWYHALVAGKVVSNESLQKAHSSFKLNNGMPTGYGYGWFLGNIQGSNMFQHGGGINGYLTASLFLPEEKVFVAVFSNCTCHGPANTAFKMAGIAIDKPYDWKEIKLTNEELSSYAAVYESGSNGQKIIRFEDGKLFSMRPGGGKFQIFPFEKDKFFFENSLTILNFQRDRKGKIVSLVSLSTQQPETWEHTDKEIPAIENISLDPELIEKYIGEYQLAPNFFLTITNEGTQLYVKATGQQKIEIKPYENNKFILINVDAQIIFNSDKNNTVTSLTLMQNGEHKAEKVK